ncbi:4-methyl-5(b-hydroxyethyl)-thiazole monophosphate biosynthesis [Halanaerobium saccharolyticum]|uniref:4-methyl-5(B-hydroxyethyl)-thiazole monophosphate biosynthesis n=1 Tax=Halanaerobium saccharolyticum TaxID=43595 RepID=A0A4R7Z0S2_9FIRM|nr:DJ-1 family glyoxalase III [Halanaerobium saccharolyticum]RAK08465.1 4-methyl-5(b-hydroxyethyl)-thiazole monophosphate biosynthesis [Halanaerobium saccharolyticum]TDW03500.1 4-methyl-5(b-hydroxyethyl)-thiazole monophosphate biosynthesis [Halanaerobium saccharolyticum]TDX59957.1 4-methyl-5(b-hydroxyethyl)-thiazole monophosphate biosynthesis [Halanaerobium saccharolyticum]
MAKILIPLAPGFEEIEAITNIDVLRRAGFDVLTAGIGSNEIEGDHGIKIETDTEISKVDAAELKAVVLPGGMPGAANLRESEELLKLIKEVYEEDKLCAAVCAGPIVLEAAGVLKGKNATSYPGFDDQMPSCNYREERVVIDENIITSRGPGVAMEFAMTIVEYLIDAEKRSELEEAMLVKK